MTMNSNVKNGKEKAKEKENKTGGSYEKDNLADIKSLRSIFEPASTRKDSKQSKHKTLPSDETQIKATPTVPQKAGHDEDMVDCSQPSMEDLLTKFRQLELETAMLRNAQGRNSRKLKADEYMQRSVSLDRKSNLTYERKVRETSRNTLKGMTIDERLQAAKSKPAKRSTDQQSQNPPDKSLSKAEINSSANGSKMESDIANEYSVSVDSIKRSLGTATVKQVVDKQVEHEELPSEGTVQALLNQWKSLENTETLKKKKRVRFGVDSSWFPQTETNPGTKSSKQIKSCLKSKTPATATDRNHNKVTVLAANDSKYNKPTVLPAQGSKKTSYHEDKVTSKAPKSTYIQPLRTTNSVNSQSPPPDIVSQVSEAENKPADELPPPSNTKALLEKFRAMQAQTKT